MNASHLQHALAALLLQLLVAWLTGDWWLGGALGVGFFWGREVAQAEYKWIQAHAGRRADMPLLAGLDVRRWSMDQRLDALMPTATVLAIGWIFG